MSAQRLTELVEALRGEVAFEIEGRRYAMPTRGPLEWAGALLDPAPDAIVPGLLDPEAAAALYDRLMDDYDPLGLDVVEDAGLWVLEQLTGRPWWEARRALLTALDSWAVFDAWCLHECAGTDPATLPLGRFCNLLVRFMELHLSEEGRDAWRASFASPPNAEALADRPEWSEEAMASDTEAFADEWASMAAAFGSASPD